MYLNECVHAFNASVEIFRIYIFFVRTTESGIKIATRNGTTVIFFT